MTSAACGAQGLDRMSEFHQKVMEGGIGSDFSKSQEGTVLTVLRTRIWEPGLAGKPGPGETAVCLLQTLGKMKCAGSVGGGSIGHIGVFLGSQTKWTAVGWTRGQSHTT